MADSELTTGLPGLDRVLHGLMPGDNLVWQVESLDDFTPLAIPYCKAAIVQGAVSSISDSPTTIRLCPLNSTPRSIDWATSRISSRSSPKCTG